MFGAAMNVESSPSSIMLPHEWIVNVLAAVAFEVTVFAWDAVADPPPVSEPVPIAFACDKSPATAAPFAPWVVAAS